MTGVGLSLDADAGVVGPARGMTVRELVALPYLRLHAIAGTSGMDREVSWAQVLDHPSQLPLFDRSSLVITGGPAIPADPAAQDELIESLAAAGHSGLIVYQAGRARLDEAALATAERRSFPVVDSQFDTSWVEIVRLVARANEGGDGQTLNAIMRVHDEVRDGLKTRRGSAELIEALSSVVGCRLSVVDPIAWEPLLPETGVPARPWRAALLDAHPTVARLESDGAHAMAVAVPLDRAACLFVELGPGPSPRLALLEHVAAACALEISRVDRMIERDRRAGATLLAEALQGHAAPKVTATRIEERGLEAPYVCVALDVPREVVDQIDRHCTMRSIPHLIADLDATHVMLIPERWSEALADSGAYRGARAGMSEPFVGAGMLLDASRQARWALETVLPGQSGIAIYGSAAMQSFLPRTLLESQQVVRRVLGPVLEYDAEHDSDLVHTLETYLECERSPKRAATLLFVHNQTVNYRIARIQELTGRSLRSTSDIAELWLALRALALNRVAPSDVRGEDRGRLGRPDCPRGRSVGRWSSAGVGGRAHDDAI